jgi:hypothetical protein
VAHPEIAPNITIITMRVIFLNILFIDYLSLFISEKYYTAPGLYVKQKTKGTAFYAVPL